MSVVLVEEPAGIHVEHLDAEPGAPQVGVTITGLDEAGTSVISVDVSWDGGVTWHGVRGARQVEVVGGAFVRDHVPPLNVEVTYRLTVHAGAVIPERLEDTVTVPSATAWVQDPLDPRAAVPVVGGRRADAVTLLASSVVDVMRRQAVDLATVEGARLPVASVGVRQAPANVPLLLRVAAEQGALVRDLRALLDRAGQLVLRGLPADLGLDAVAHVVAPGATELPVAGGVIGLHTDWLLSVTQTRPTSLRVVVPWWTYDQVKALWVAAFPLPGPTYDAVLAARPGDTYLDWLRDPATP